MSNIFKTKSCITESIITIVIIIYVQISPTYGHDNSNFLSDGILTSENSQGIDLYNSKQEQSEPFYMNEKLPAGWIDPFDMSVDEDSVKWMDYSFDERLENTKDHFVYENTGRPTVKTNHLSYLQRFVNLILRAVNVKKSYSSSSGVEVVNIEFIITERDFNMLKDFADKGEEGGTKLEFVADILDRIFPRKPKDEQSDLSFEATYKLARNVIKKLSSPEWAVVFSTSVMLIITLWFAKVSSLRMAICSLFITIFVFGYGFTWMRMYEEREVEKYVHFAKHGNAPYHCAGSPLEWYEHMYYRAFGIDCVEFFKVRDVRPMLKISPSDVLAETISSMLINPSKNCGQAYGDFIYGVTDSAPFLLKPIAVVMGFIMPLSFLMLILCFLFGYEIKLSPFGFYLKPSWFCYKTSVKEHTCSNEKYIEEVSQTKNHQKINSNINVNEAKFMERKKLVALVKNLMTNLDNQSSEPQKPNSGCNKSTSDNLETLDKGLSSSHYCADQKDNVLKLEDDEIRDVEEEFCLISLEGSKLKVYEQCTQNSNPSDHSRNSSVEAANIIKLNSIK